MSFRRGKSKARAAARWREFKESRFELFARTGLPHSIRSDREMFDDFLMHGCIDHHPDPTHFMLEDMSESQVAAFKELIVEYFRAGFPDPGLMLFGSEEEDRLRREAEGR